MYGVVMNVVNREYRSFSGSGLGSLRKEKRTVDQIIERMRER